MYVVIHPNSTSVLFGQDATFSCTGEGLAIVWTLDGTNVDELGIEATNDIINGIRISTLTIIGSVETNNVSIQCVIIRSDSIPVLSEPVFLTVLGKP